MTELDMFSKEEGTKIFIELGIPANLQGFRFLQDCIIKVVAEPEYIKKVTKTLYPEIGKKHMVNPMVVERSMRHATDVGYYKTGFKALNKLFGLECKILAFKPTNCELIAIISEALRFKAHRLGLLKTL